MHDLILQSDRNDHQRIRIWVRRQCNKNGKATGDYTTTIGAIAKSVRMAPETVAEHLDDAYLVILGKDGPVEAWTVEEDGE